MTRALLLVAAAGATFGLIACGGDGGDGNPQTTPKPKSATMKAAWSVDAGPLWNPPLATTSAWAWTTDAAVIVPEKRALTAYASADGAKQWTVELPKPVCAIVDAPNEDGIAAVMLAGGTEVNDEACGTVAAVDVNAGKLLWSRSLHGISDYGMTEVQVGRDAVAVTNPCDRALTFSVHDGTPLVSLPRSTGDGCEHAFASDGRVVIDGDHHADRDMLVGYDAVSGRRQWSVPVGAAHGPRTTPERVISDAPLVVDASIDNHRFLYRVDPDARKVTPFGREADDSFPPLFTQQIGDNVVVQYGHSPELFAYDPTSGEEVSHAVLGAGESAFGVRDGDVVTAGAPSEGLRDVGFAVRGVEPASGTQQPLGTGKLDGVSATFGRGTGFDLALSGDTMILSVDGKLLGYRLGAPGSVDSPVSPSSRVGQDELELTKAASLCTGITQATKRQLGFPDPSLGAPANCEWVESVADGGIRILQVSAQALEPAKGQTGTVRARALVAQMRRADPLNDFAALSPLAGVGDEAAAGTSRESTSRVARVVARTGNVVIFVQVIGSEAGPRADELRTDMHGAQLAAADMVAEAERRG